MVEEKISEVSLESSLKKIKPNSNFNKGAQTSLLVPCGTTEIIEEKQQFLKVESVQSDLVMLKTIIMQTDNRSF